VEGHAPSIPKPRHFQKEFQGHLMNAICAAPFTRPLINGAAGLLQSMVEWFVPRFLLKVYSSLLGFSLTKTQEQTQFCLVCACRGASQQTRNRSDCVCPG